MIVIEGNGSRPSHRGDGVKESETMYCLNQVDRHAVCYRKVRRAASKDDYETWVETKESNTLNCFDMGGVRSTTVICYAICSYDSNAMKSSNPHSGIYEAETSRTLDNNGGNPACNQGGIIVCEKRN